MRFSEQNVRGRLRFEYRDRRATSAAAVAIEAAVAKLRVAEQDDAVAEDEWRRAVRHAQRLERARVGRHHQERLAELEAKRVIKQ